MSEKYLDDMKSTKLIHITTVPATLNFFLGQIGFLKTKGFNVEAITSPGEEARDIIEKEQINIHTIEMAREINPVGDLIALLRLWRLLLKIKPDVVHSHTPKAGLLGTLAARAAGVKCVVLSVFGLPQMTRTGFSHSLLNFTTRMACRLADMVWCDSSSMRDYLTGAGLCSTRKAVVMGSGSVNGVDAERTFSPHKIDAQALQALKRGYGIPRGAMVMGFAGRVVGDKGMRELAEAWQMLRESYPSLHLLIVGPFEKEDPIRPEDEAVFRNDSRVHLAGKQSDMAAHYAAMNIFVMPSYREGFGVSNIEASAMTLPVVATRIPGCIDSVEDGVSGTLVPVRDANALRAAIAAYCDDEELRIRHGQAGRDRVIREFRQERIWNDLYSAYSSLFNKKAKRIAEPIGDILYISAKRLLDLVISVSLLLFLAPMFFLLCGLIRLKMGSPVLFCQMRPGLNGRPFKIFKLRTMRDAHDEQGRLLPDAERLTRFGQFLRNTSLDELPELINVLNGEMSLVGPRPLLTEYLDRYTPEQMRRHDVKPGITGWAQVNGRNSLSWEKKFELDVWYVDHRSLWLDIQILWITLMKVLKRDGITAEGHSTMPIFMGNGKNQDETAGA
jgi:lipopolysaccharide/colanic/teichoic acid biosynthesis glycosyltransferase/glycosyltransferase involved in cell wall biosynthesis